ncbi:hypothetical protein [Devosia sp. A369]
MLTSIIQSAAAGWIWRRAQELGSLATIFVPIYLAMPQSMKNDVHAIFSGQGGGLTISAAIGLGWYVWTQLQSYRATTVAQVVTKAGQKILPKPDSAAMGRVETQAKAAPKRQTLWERLTGN